MAAPIPLAAPVMRAVLLSRRKKSRIFCMVKLNVPGVGKQGKCRVLLKDLHLQQGCPEPCRCGCFSGVFRLCEVGEEANNQARRRRSWDPWRNPFRLMKPNYMHLWAGQWATWVQRCTPS